MMTTRLFLSFLFAISVAYVKADCTPDQTAPAFSKTYTVKGVLNIPYAELTEPFYAWYDEASKQSRIDYYGDMVKTYQLGNYENFGTSIKVVPVTTDTESNVRECLQVNGTSDESIDIQGILPALDGFSCEGQEDVDGVSTEKWGLNQTIGDKLNKYTIWLTYKTNPSNSEKTPVPVRYEMKGYNTLLGSHYDHYYLDYTDYSDDDISPSVFQIDGNLTCTSFPGPGIKQIYTFNPMKEFVHPITTSHVDLEFEKFKHKHGKKYSNLKEHAVRMENFRQNLRYINSHNRKNLGFTLAVNHLSDKSDAEIEALRGRRYSGVYNGGQPFPYENIKEDDLPDQWDWRLYGAVTPVKDQSVCGSCWSFGTAGTVEGAYFLKNKKLVRLSQQALIDCSWGYGNNGCDGGEDFRSYEWMLKHGGIPTEEEYGPYLGNDGYCHADKTDLVAELSGWVNVTVNDENALKLAIFKNGPVSVAIDASHKTFSFYSNGVYYEPTCGNRDDQLDHAVLAVGYGTIDGNDYWLVKNSWSTYWGNDGYILMAAKDNNCGVMTTPTYVVLK